MALILGKAESYDWPVTLETPADGGRFEKITFTARFKRLGQARIDEIVSALRDGGDGLTDRTIVDDVLIGWDKVLDADGQPIDFTPVNVAAVLEVEGVRAAIVKAWFESLSGKRKN